LVVSADTTAEEVARQLKLMPRPRSDNSDEIAAPPQLKFFATDSAEKFRKMGTRFLGLPVENVVHVDLKE
jgi:glutamate racemase